MSKQIFWWAVASAGLMVIGGFAPWASVLDVVTVNGTEGDGWFLIVGGALSATLLIIRFTTNDARRWFVIVSLVAAAICVLVSIVDLADIGGVAGDEGGFDLSAAVDVEWGLYVSLLASLSLAAATIVLLASERGRATAPAAAPGAPAAGGLPPADWYPDPQGEKRLRYWDGSAWTSHTAD